MTKMTATTKHDALVKKVKPGASWKEKEVHVLPENRLGIVYFGLMCAMFLASVDQTIVATALPTIVENLGGGNSYSWAGSAYMLSAAAFGPLYGKLSNMFGRKPILYMSILIFLFGSAMCGAAQNMTWLILCRAIQGIGGGGIMQVVIIVIGDIVPLKDRGRYSGIISTMYAVASITGPIIGGGLAQHVSWRWCFFINLPIGGVSAVIIYIFLNLNPHEKRPIRDQVAELDFVGFVCLVGGVACLLIGLNFSQLTWTDARTIAPLVIGIGLLVMGAVNEVLTKSSAILPPRLFKTRTTVILLITVFSHVVVLYSTAYYLPLSYQILGASPTDAGIKMVIYSLGVSLTAVAAGFIMSRTGRYRSTIWVAFAVMTFGMGLMTMLNSTSNVVSQRIFPLIAAVGIGILYPVLLVALQAAMPLKDMATTSSTFMFLSTLGGAVGIAVGEAIITGVLPRKLAGIPQFGTLGLGTVTVAVLNNNIGNVHLIPDVALRNAVMHAWSEAIAMIWTMSTYISGFTLILTFFLREYSLDRKVVRASDEAKICGDPEECMAESPSNEAHPRIFARPASESSDVTVVASMESKVDKEEENIDAAQAV